MVDVEVGNGDLGSKLARRRSEGCERNLPIRQAQRVLKLRILIGENEGLKTPMSEELPTTSRLTSR